MARATSRDDFPSAERCGIGIKYPVLRRPRGTKSTNGFDAEEFEQLQDHLRVFSRRLVMLLVSPTGGWRASQVDDQL